MDDDELWLCFSLVVVVAGSSEGLHWLSTVLAAVLRALADGPTLALVSLATGADARAAVSLAVCFTLASAGSTHAVGCGGREGRRRGEGEVKNVSKCCITTHKYTLNQGREGNTFIVNSDTATFE